MGLLIECPKCGHWNSANSLACKGIFRSGINKGQHCKVGNLRRIPDKEYLIEYRSYDGKKIRERVGTNRNDAELRLLNAKQEKNDQVLKVESKTTLNELFQWYLNLSEVKAKRAYRRVEVRTKALGRLLNTQERVGDLTVRKLELYVAQRSSEDSPTNRGEKIAPKTVKEELNLLRSMINKAVDYKILNTVPVKGHLYPKIDIDNTRQRIFSADELDRILAASPLWLRRIIIMAQGTGMRQNEILQLNWDSVDLERGFVRLKGTQTKAGKSRLVKLLPDVIEMLRQIPRKQNTRRVFVSSTGRPLPYWTTYCHDTWHKALLQAGVSDACFHDLRHDFITKAVRAGNPYYVVMKQVGHSSDAMLRRYHLIDENDLDTLKM